MYQVSQLIALLLTIITMLSCGGEQQKNPPKEPEEQPHAGLNVMRVVIAGDQSPSFVFGFAESIKSFRRTFGDIQKNHVLVAPGNESQLGLSPDDAVVHSKDEDHIGAEILELVRVHNPERMVLFLDTHGAISGALCYKSENSCTLDAQKFITIINELDNSNTNKPPQNRLKQILLVPRACYNKALAVKIFDELKQGPTKSFSIAMTHMIEVNPGKCGTGISVGEALFNQTIQVYESKPWQFKNWITANDRLDRLRSLNNLADLVSFANDAMSNNLTTGAKQHEEVSVFPATLTARNFDLAQFELIPRLITILKRGSHTPANQNVVNQQYTASPQDVVSGYIGIPELEAKVLSMHDRLKKKRYHAGTTEYKNPITWNFPTIVDINIALP